jgi:hypothetical protein
MANPLTGAPENPLEQLRDIHLPEAVSWWPLAPGWWLLIIGGCLLSLWLIRFFYRRHSASLYRRQALQQLEQLRSGSDSEMPLREFFQLLKQTANSAYPNHHPGSFNNRQFIAFLKDSCNRSVFDNLKLDIDQALYSDRDPVIEHRHRDRLFKDASIWIKQHCREDKLERGKPC